MDIERRIERAEKAIEIEAGPVTVPAIIICKHWSPDDKVPHFPEPVSEWLTVTKEREAAVRDRLPQLSIANPFAEYEARHGLEPGTLTKHPLCDKVPFDELLAAAVLDQGEQPCKKD